MIAAIVILSIAAGILALIAWSLKKTNTNLNDELSKRNKEVIKLAGDLILSKAWLGLSLKKHATNKTSASNVSHIMNKIDDLSNNEIGEIVQSILDNGSVENTSRILQSLENQPDD